MKFVPVIIPTLNRRTHLERCLKSLANNEGAKKTKVIISVDYPPASKYVEGYNKVKDFLNNLRELNNAFEEITVIYQDKNLGPNGNCKFLKQYVGEISDEYIFTEDDNEFSSNFLLYINKGLEKFEKDESVIGICAYKDTNWEYGNKNYAKMKTFPGYGVGLWKNKDALCEKNIVDALLGDSKKIKNNIKELKGKSKALETIYVNDVLLGRKSPFWLNGKLCMIDTTRSLYMFLSDVVCIVPEKTKSITYGNDGSGVNMAAVDMDMYLKKHILDKDVTFDYSDGEVEFITENYIKADKYIKSVIGNKSYIKCKISLLILLFCNYDYKKASKCMCFIEKIYRK